MGDDLGDCAEYGTLALESGQNDYATSSEGLPWSGLGLGSDDVAAVGAIGRPAVVALVGAASAGKTTALAAAFLAIRRGRLFGGGSFAGSFTLLGWQIMSSYMQWPPHGNGGFPPHTTAVDVRSPCLLHLRLRDKADDKVREVLLSDMPGEWFSAWAIKENDSAGASWLAECADSFVVFADSEALASSQRGRARADYEALARRVHSAAESRPIIPVLSKTDIAVPEPLLRHVDRVNAALFFASALPISARAADAPAVQVLDKAVRLAMRKRSRGPASDAPETAWRQDDPLLAYRSAALSVTLRDQIG